MTATAIDRSLLETLTTIVGPDHVILDETERHYMSADVYSEGTLTGAIVRPGDTEQLSQVVAHATAADIALFPRGGGNSYTGGYLPTTTRAITIDTTRMDRILEINLEDMYVTVEAGVTWAALKAALDEKGVRTPFWGPLSGLRAVVGAGISQNSVFFGASNAGSSADSVLSLDVVIADGSVIRTGSAGTEGGSPFFRYYGPDLTGLFTCDCGALGIKATVTLKLMQKKPEQRYASFAFEGYEAMAVAMSAVARTGLGTEIFGFDPFLQAQRMKRESLMRDVKTLGKVMQKSGSVIGALKEGAKLALKGRRYMDDVAYSCHIALEERTASGADEALATVRRICTAEGREIENAIPKITHSYPFGPLNSMLGPTGERWLPIHCIVPHSKAVDAIKTVEDLKVRHAEDLDRLGIGIGYLVTTCGATAYVLEPVLYWPGKRLPIHERHVEASHLARLKDFPEDAAVDTKIRELRAEIRQTFSDLGAAHLQIGRTYPYADTRLDANLALIKGIKQVVDPKGLMNPGSLGLD